MDAFDFDLGQFLREPLYEQLYFARLDPDWLFYRVKSTLPAAWPAGGAYVTPEAIRVSREGDVFHQFDVVIAEVWDTDRGEAHITVARDDRGDVVADTAAVLTIQAEKEPRGWAVKVLCYASFAEAHFRRLVAQLREAGGIGDAPAASGPKGGRPRGTSDDVRWRAQLFKRIKDENPKWTGGQIAKHAWANYEADLMAHGFMKAPTRSDVTNDRRGEKWRE